MICSMSMTLIGVSNAQLEWGLLAIFLVALGAVCRVLLRRTAHRRSMPTMTVPSAPGRLPAKLSSEGLAGLVVQALVDAKFVEEKSFSEATEVAARRIELRKAIGDY
jgi:hypothetical protein